MKILLLFFLLIGLGLLGFCWWGLATAVGNTAFPEMAGLYPFYAGGLGGAIVIVTGLIYAFRLQRRAGFRLRERRKSLLSA